MSVWDLLRAELVPRKRPENSITPAEFAKEAGYSVGFASKKLRDDPRLKQVHYRTPGGKDATCYVLAEGGHVH